MTSIIDVAAYILKTKRAIATMQIHRLIYLANLEHEQDFQTPLITNVFSVKPHTVIYPELFAEHAGEFVITHPHFTDGNPDRLTREEKVSIDKTLEQYGHIPGCDLANILYPMTHKDPQ